MIFSLFWKRTTLAGAIAGMVGGFLGVVVWKNAVAPLGSGWAIYELLPAFIFSVLCIVFVSLITKKPTEEMVAEFERATK
jgi:sodium/proline symporter